MLYVYNLLILQSIILSYSQKNFFLYIHRPTHPLNGTHAQQTPSHNQITSELSKRNSHTKTVENALSKGIVESTYNQRTADRFYNSSANTMSDSDKNVRDRLGLWGLANDTEIAGAVSGLERIKNPRYNKVRKLFSKL